MKHKLCLLFSVILFSLPCYASDFNAENISLLWCLPFVLVLLSIALGPIIFLHTWEHHYGKIVGIWSLLFIIPFVFYNGFSVSSHEILLTLIEEYLPFILLLLALFTVSGGILVWGKIEGTPKMNTTILLIGTVLASVMGTTGAAMLLIRPLIRANSLRKHRVHTFVFFIFLVANIGGGVTPLGDPPLFLGFLQGVEFMWTVKHMFLPVLFNSVILLVVYYILDLYFFKKEDLVKIKEKTVGTHFDKKITLYGKWNILLLLGIIGSVVLSGLWKPNISIGILGVNVKLEVITRDILLIIITLLSLLITPTQVRSGNEFNWEPIKEVAKLFIAIFITIIPVLAILKTGESGHFGQLISLVKTPHGDPINWVYFWMTGFLSAFLDNAPTYLVFFNMASGDAQILMDQYTQTLLAISMGAVFMGAITYIGNAPNFMVKSICENRQIRMPTFFSYMLWSLSILIPIFIIDTFVFLL